MLLNFIDDFENKINWIIAIAAKVFNFVKNYWWKALLIYFIYLFIKYYFKQKKYEKENMDSLNVHAQKFGYTNYEEYKKRFLKDLLRKRKEKIEENRDLSPEQKHILELEDMLWEKKNPSVLDGAFNANYKEMVKTQLENYELLGIEKDLDFTKDPKANEFFKEIEYDFDGKIKRGITSVFGKVTFSYFDQNGNNIYSKTSPFTEVQFSLASGQFGKEGRKNCVNCGAPIEFSNLDTYTCPHCKSILYKEDYDKLVTQLNYFSYNSIDRVKFSLLDFINRHKIFIVILSGLGIIIYYFGQYYIANILGPRLANGKFSPLIPFLGALAPLGLYLSEPIKKHFEEKRLEKQEEKDRLDTELYNFKKSDPLFSLELAKSELFMMLKSMLLAKPSKKDYFVQLYPILNTGMKSKTFCQNMIGSLIF